MCPLDSLPRLALNFASWALRGLAFLTVTGPALPPALHLAPSTAHPTATPRQSLDGELSPPRPGTTGSRI